MACIVAFPAVAAATADNNSKTWLIPEHVSEIVASEDPARFYILAVKVPENVLPQIRELDFKKQKDRRVTWQDGEIESFDVRPGDHLVYASTTDEIKERLHPVERPATQGLPSEIYLSDHYGQVIDRVTTHPGFDGQCAFSADGSHVIAIEHTEAGDEILKLSADGRQKVVLEKANHSIRSSPVMSQDGQIAWLERPEGSTTELQEVRVLGQRTPFYLIRRSLMGLRRIPHQSGWLAFERMGELTRVLRINKNCEKILAEIPTGFVSADISPDLSRLLVATELASGSEISWKDLPKEAFTCETTDSGAKLAP